MKKKVTGNLSWVGYLDWELQKFHGDEFSVDSGSSQNSYILEEEKTVLFDTVWTPHRDWFLQNLKKEIDLNKIDYIVMNHGEQDHSGTLPSLMEEIPDTPIYCTAQCVKSLEGQYGKKGWNFHVVKTGDTLDIGNGKKLTFIEMKMLHWPDSMATYISGYNVLISMDAFGQHYACEELFNDRADQDKLYFEALKYFANILGPFTRFVTPKIEEIKGMGLPIDYICPAHGVIWRDNTAQILDLYEKWADPDYKEDLVTICYDTMWDGTKKIAHAIAKEIYRQSPTTKVHLYNVAKKDKNDIMTDVWKSKAIAVGSPTCVNTVLTSVDAFLSFLKTLHLPHKKAAAFGCYGWSGESVGIIQKTLKDAGLDVINEEVKSYWNPDEDDFAKIPALVKDLLSDDKEDDMEVTQTPEGRKFVCKICGWVYEEAKGCPEQGIAPGTKWEDLPDTFHCQLCHAPKDQFEEVK